MNLKILMGILLYYALISMFFFFGGTTLDGYSNTANLSAVDITSSNSSYFTPSIFQTQSGFIRFWLFMNFGIGLGAGTPAWFSFIFILWQTAFSIFVVGFIISSIWNG